MFVSSACGTVAVPAGKAAGALPGVGFVVEVPLCSRQKLAAAPGPLSWLPLVPPRTSSGLEVLTQLFPADPMSPRSHFGYKHPGFVCAEGLCPGQASPHAVGWVWGSCGAGLAQPVAVPQEAALVDC